MRRGRALCGMERGGRKGERVMRGEGRGARRKVTRAVDGLTGTKYVHGGADCEPWREKQKRRCRLLRRLLLRFSRPLLRRLLRDDFLHGVHLLLLHHLLFSHLLHHLIFSHHMLPHLVGLGSGLASRASSPPQHPMAPPHHTHHAPCPPRSPRPPVAPAALPTAPPALLPCCPCCPALSPEPRALSPEPRALSPGP